MKMDAPDHPTQSVGRPAYVPTDASKQLVRVLKANGIGERTLRDARYAVECGDTAFSGPFRRLLLRAIAIGRRRDTLKDTTLKQYLADLERRLDRVMAAVPIGEPGRKLRKRIAANRSHLFVFVTNRDVPYTNNVSERHLRPSVVFRKVTNGFRCEWGAETYAAFRSVVSTAKANGASVLAVLRFVLAAKLPVEPAVEAG